MVPLAKSVAPADSNSSSAQPASSSSASSDFNTVADDVRLNRMRCYILHDPNLCCLPMFQSPAFGQPVPVARVLPAGSPWAKGNPLTNKAIAPSGKPSDGKPSADEVVPQAVSLPAVSQPVDEEDTAAHQTPLEHAVLDESHFDVPAEQQQEEAVAESDEKYAEEQVEEEVSVEEAVEEPEVQAEPEPEPEQQPEVVEATPEPVAEPEVSAAAAVAADSAAAALPSITPELLQQLLSQYGLSVEMKMGQLSVSQVATAAAASSSAAPAVEAAPAAAALAVNTTGVAAPTAPVAAAPVAAAPAAAAAPVAAAPAVTPQNLLEANAAKSSPNLGAAAAPFYQQPFQQPYQPYPAFGQQQAYDQAFGYGRFGYGGAASTPFQMPDVNTVSVPETMFKLVHYFISVVSFFLCDSLTAGTCTA